MISENRLRAKFPGLLCKAWAIFDGTTGTLQQGMNCTTTRTGVGLYTVTFTTAMSSANYLMDYWHETKNVSFPTGVDGWIREGVKATGSITLIASSDASDSKCIYVAFYE